MAPTIGETFTVTCFTCGMPSSKEWAQLVRSRHDGGASEFYPFLLETRAPPQGAIMFEDGSSYLCAFCHALLQSQWNAFEGRKDPVPQNERKYQVAKFICAVCGVQTYRKRVRALPFQDFPFLDKTRHPGSITLGDNPLAVVCLDCSETLWAQSAEYDRWGLPVHKRHFNWMARPPPPEDSIEATVARLPSGETQLPRCPPTDPLVPPKTNEPCALPETIAPVKFQRARANSVATVNAASSSGAKFFGHGHGHGHHSHMVHRQSSPLSMPVDCRSPLGHAAGHHIHRKLSGIPMFAEQSQPPVVTVAPMSLHHGHVERKMSSSAYAFSQMDPSTSTSHSSRNLSQHGHISRTPQYLDHQYNPHHQHISHHNSGPVPSHYWHSLAGINSHHPIDEDDTGDYDNYYTGGHRSASSPSPNRAISLSRHARSDPQEILRHSDSFHPPLFHGTSSDASTHTGMPRLFPHPQIRNSSPSSIIRGVSSSPSDRFSPQRHVSPSATVVRPCPSVSPPTTPHSIGRCVNSPLNIRSRTPSETGVVLDEEPIVISPNPSPRPIRQHRIYSMPIIPKKRQWQPSPSNSPSRSPCSRQILEDIPIHEKKRKESMSPLIPCGGKDSPVDSQTKFSIAFLCKSELDSSSPHGQDESGLQDVDEPDVLESGQVATPPSAMHSTSTPTIEYLIAKEEQARANLNSIRRKQLGFLNRLGLISQEEKMDLELKSIARKGDVGPVPPLKLRGRQTPPRPIRTFSAPVPNSRVTLSTAEQVHFLGELGLRPAEDGEANILMPEPPQDGPLGKRCLEETESSRQKQEKVVAENHHLDFSKLVQTVQTSVSHFNRSKELLQRAVKDAHTMLDGRTMENTDKSFKSRADVLTHTIRLSVEDLDLRELQNLCKELESCLSKWENRTGSNDVE